MLSTRGQIKTSGIWQSISYIIILRDYIIHSELDLSSKSIDKPTLVTCSPELLATTSSLAMSSLGTEVQLRNRGRSKLTITCALTRKVKFQQMNSSTNLLLQRVPLKIFSNQSIRVKSAIALSSSS